MSVSTFLNKLIKDMNIVTCINCHTEFGNAKEIEMYIRCECGTDIVNDEGYENPEPSVEQEPEWRGWLNQMTARQDAYHKR
jgi:hypothetical protein